jgi:hypothetical protein
MRVDVEGQLDRAVTDLGAHVAHIFPLGEEQAHVGVPEAVEAAFRRPEPRLSEEGHQPLPVPAVRDHWPPRRLTEDVPLADGRVHKLVDGEVVEEGLRDVNDPVRV